MRMGMRSIYEDLLAGMALRVPSKLIDFGRALDTFFGDSVDFDWPYFLEKPHKWTDEYAAWANADYPQDGDKGWDEFVKALEAMAGV